ncbi:phenylalanine--tRNA ligase subunit beta [Saccharibacter sp. 17.LH.SD]|uniref:phenylalanine--tRNA ligase subunit beta n=1 Tax=Saccharibacter sp. 17.LH.SD TaxID=2689393 RepID=UPI00136CAFF5|nr:phenylalanine--tRNA ligase subunit beta [Saccharibacter sp. 17.LH.SD]MXV44742.1 phenylalanine--tRNA ligase subunit beta [Saccharibacter sp. 17.LH.SD]
MKFSLSWLRDYLDFSVSLEELCATLNRIGLEVEGVDDPSKRLSGLRTALIKEATRHPDADRLQLCRVDGGTGFEDVQVVCGAPNARSGLHVIFAPPGTYIPGSDITIKAGKIRGQASGGMLCSLKELGLGEESNGIAELPEEAPIGADYVRYAKLDDPVIDIAITPNRGDALSVRGIARDLAAAGIGTLKPYVPAKVERHGESSIKWHIDHPACSYVTGTLIHGVTNGPSPAWLKRRLESVGVRPQSALVDVTNYLMIALGRPLHVFDAQKLKGKCLTLTHAARETFRALDGQDYVLGTQDLVIVDENGVQSLAGIIGGEHSAVDDMTTDVFLESAFFDAVQIALTGRRLGVQTDARYRFERGIDPAFVKEGLEAATALILELCGGIATEVTEAGQVPQWQRRAGLRFERLKSFGGLEVSARDAVASLEKLGFEVLEQTEEKAVFSVPSWRNDIASGQSLDQARSLSKEQAEMAAVHVADVEAEVDLIEEILRLRGLDAVPAVPLPQTTMVPAAALTPQQARNGALRRLCASRGMMETIGFSFVSDQDAALFDDVTESERLLNPIATDLNQLRPTPLINLLSALKRNIAHGFGVAGEASFFELGPCFGQKGAHLVLAGVRGGTTARAPGHAAIEPSWIDAKADLIAALESISISESSLNTTADAPAYYHPGRSGQLRQGPKKILGRFGELHPRVARHFGRTGSVAIFELLVDDIPLSKTKRKAPPILSALQPVRRDFAFLAGKEVTIQDVIRAVRGVDRKLIEDVRLFDIFEGGSLPEGYRSLGIEVVLQPQGESLKEVQLEAFSQAVEEAVKKATGATLRR